MIISECVIIGTTASCLSVEISDGRGNTTVTEKKSLNPDELDHVSGGREEYAPGYFYIVFQDPYEKVGPFDTVGQADAYMSGISGRPYEIIIDF